MTADFKSQLLSQSSKLQIPKIEIGKNLNIAEKKHSTKELLDQDSVLAMIVNAEEIEFADESLKSENSEEVENHLAKLDLYIRDAIFVLDNISNDFNESGYGKVKKNLGDNLKIEGYKDLIIISKTNGLDFKIISNHIENNNDKKQEVVGQIGEYDFLKKLDLVFEEYLGELEKLSKDLEKRQNPQQAENNNEGVKESIESESKTTEIGNLINKVKQLKTEFEAARLQLSKMFEDMRALDPESADREMMDVMMQAFKEGSADPSKIFDLCREIDPEIVDRFLKEGDGELKNYLVESLDKNLGLFLDKIGFLKKTLPENAKLIIDQISSDLFVKLDGFINRGERGLKKIIPLLRVIKFANPENATKFVYERKKQLSDILKRLISDDSRDYKNFISILNSIDPDFGSDLMDNKEDIYTNLKDILVKNPKSLDSFFEKMEHSNPTILKELINDNRVELERLILLRIDTSKNILAVFNKANPKFVQNLLINNEKQLIDKLFQKTEVKNVMLDCINNLYPDYVIQLFESNKEVITKKIIDNLSNSDLINGLYGLIPNIIQNILTEKRSFVESEIASLISENGNSFTSSLRNISKIDSEFSVNFFNNKSDEVGKALINKISKSPGNLMDFLNTLTSEFKTDFFKNKKDDVENALVDTIYAFSDSQIHDIVHLVFQEYPEVILDLLKNKKVELQSAFLKIAAEKNWMNYNQKLDLLKTLSPDFAVDFNGTVLNNYGYKYTISIPAKDDFINYVDNIFSKIDSSEHFDSFQGQDGIKNIIMESLRADPEATQEVLNKMDAHFSTMNNQTWQRVKAVLRIPGFGSELSIGRVEESFNPLDDKPIGIPIEGGMQTMAFQHLPNTTKKVLDILQDPKELPKQLMNPNSELSILLPELLNFAPENTVSAGKYDLPENSPYTKLTPSGPYQHDYHKYQNLLQHTLKVVESVQGSNIYQKASQEEKIIMTLAALSHDLGKPTTQKRGEAQADDSHGYKSVKLAYQIGDRLNLPYSMKAEIPNMVDLKEEIAKLTEVINFKLPDEEKLHELAIRLGSEKFLDMTMKLGEMDSFRVKDSFQYIDSYKPNREALVEGLKPIIRYYENLNYPVISEVDQLLRHPNQRQLSVDQGNNPDGTSKQSTVQLIDLREGGSYRVNLHVTNELRADYNPSKSPKLDRGAVEVDSLLCTTYASTDPSRMRIFSNNQNALILRATPVNVDLEDTFSASGKTLSTIANEKQIQNKIKVMAYHKFKILQSEFFGSNAEEVSSRDLVKYFHDGDLPDGVDKEKFLEVADKIEEFNIALNYYQKYSKFPESLSPKDDIDLTGVIERLSNLLISYNNQEKMEKDGYEPEKAEQISFPGEINELNSIRNEVAGLLIRVKPGMTDEDIKTNHQKELEFAIKHNVPVVVMGM